MKRFFFSMALGIVALTGLSTTASAALSSQDDVRAAVGDVLQTHQYRLPESRVAGQESVRQQVTVWEVTAGSWNGESLKGLSLVLVRNCSDSGPTLGTISCYISHLATAAQRNALISAFMAAQSIAPAEVTTWRIEPAVIRFENAGDRVIVHLGLVA